MLVDVAAGFPRDLAAQATSKGSTPGPGADVKGAAGADVGHRLEELAEEVDDTAPFWDW